MCLYLIIHVKRCQDKNMTCHRNLSPSHHYAPEYAFKHEAIRTRIEIHKGDILCSIMILVQHTQLTIESKCCKTRLKNNMKNKLVPTLYIFL